MNSKIPSAVLFDCWSTVITFEALRDDWNTESLKRHCVNPEEVDFAAVHRFVEDFFHQYYMSLSGYEIQIRQLLSLVLLQFDIRLDCPVEVCTHEILTNLDPHPVEHVTSFLEALEEREIPYAILSNTVYDDRESFDIVRRLLPGRKFRFFLGSATLGVKKPNPLFFQAGLHLLGSKANETIYIGDSFLADVNGSYHAGFRQSYWLNPKGKDPEVYRSLLPDFEKIQYRETRSYAELTNRLLEGELF